MPKLSDTAFLVNWSKAQNPALSKDPWAHLWVTKKSARFAEAFTAKVSAGHPLVPALRNRFFVEAIQTFEQKVGSFTFINIAAGFTSYPYLIDSSNPVYEIELPPVVAYRKEKLRDFETAGRLPHREIHFISIDLNSAQALTQIDNLISEQNGHPLFILMEGILYYLTQQTIDSLFSLFNTKLPPKSQVGFVTWPFAIQNTKTMKVLKNFFEVELGFPHQQYTWLDRESFQRWKRLRCLEQTSYVDLEKKYGEKPYRLTFENIVNESVFLFEVK